MQYRPLGSSGLKVSAVGLGSWLTIGKAVDDHGSALLVRRAFDAGVTLFDTADVYNMGEGERALGRAIAELPRDRLVVATKCYFPMSDDPNDRGLSRKHIHQSIRRSLARLGTDYVDLYQCHRYDDDTPLVETAQAMHDLVVQGHALYWGVSMWPAERIAEVTALCRQHGWHQPVSNQPLYNLFRRDIEAAVVPTSKRCGLGQLVYSPLAQGVLTGKYLPGKAPPAGSRATDADGKKFVERYLGDEHLQKAAKLVALAERFSVTATQLALAWCLREPNVAAVLVGARDEQQLLHNLSAVDVTVPAECLAELDTIFPA